MSFRFDQAKKKICHMHFKEGFGHYPDQNMPFKGENKWEGSGRLNLNGLDI